MMSDDLEPRRPDAGPRNLDAMSIEALTDYVGELRAEIERVEAVIREKDAARDSAASVFKV
ncbi:MAG: DUF1192 domain-containing protein [Alphaproteobacteria bacterium]|jgi:uncharacterized small protein (DUF1192 family)